MIHHHPDDDVIQQYVLDPSHCDASTVEHLTTCEDCKAAVAFYQFLITGVQQEEVPVFDFNVTELVMKQIPARRHGLSVAPVFTILIVLGIVLLTGSLFFIFRANLISLFEGIKPLFLYLMIAIAGTYLIIQGLEISGRFKKAMDALDIS